MRRTSGVRWSNLETLFPTRTSSSSEGQLEAMASRSSPPSLLSLSSNYSREEGEREGGGGGEGGWEGEGQENEYNKKHTARVS